MSWKNPGKARTFPGFSHDIWLLGIWICLALLMYYYVVPRPTLLISITPNLNRPRTQQMTQFQIMCKSVAIVQNGVLYFHNNKKEVEWGPYALRHWIQSSMQAILACHPAVSIEWLAGWHFTVYYDVCARPPLGKTKIFVEMYKTCSLSWLLSASDRVNDLCLTWHSSRMFKFSCTPLLYLVTSISFLDSSLKTSRRACIHTWFFLFHRPRPPPPPLFSLTCFFCVC